MVGVIEITGALAILVSTVIMLPEFIHIYRTKNTNVSVNMILLSVVSQAMWFAYGYLIRDTLLMVSCVPTFLLNLATYILFNKYKR